MIRVVPIQVLEAKGAAADFKPEPALPKLWTETLVSDLEWQRWSSSI